MEENNGGLTERPTLGQRISQWFTRTEPLPPAPEWEVSAETSLESVAKEAVGPVDQRDLIIETLARELEIVRSAYRRMAETKVQEIHGELVHEARALVNRGRAFSLGLSENTVTLVALDGTVLNFVPEFRTDLIGIRNTMRNLAEQHGTPRTVPLEGTLGSETGQVEGDDERAVFGMLPFGFKGES